MKERPRFAVLLCLLLFVMWLLLNISLAPGHLLLGAVLAIFLARSSRGLRPVPPTIKRVHVAISLVWTVFIDIVKSNVMVARVVLMGPRGAGPGFVKIPLEMRDPHGLAMLAMILTATPGTVWVDMDRQHGKLTLHILDLHEEEAWIATVKRRYEAPLMEIFE